MAEPRVIIEHPDGRRYSVTPEAWAERYEGEGFAVVGPESPDDATWGPPVTARRRSTGRARHRAAMGEGLEVPLGAVGELNGETGESRIVAEAGSVEAEAFLRAGPVELA